MRRLGKVNAASDDALDAFMATNVSGLNAEEAARLQREEVARVWAEMQLQRESGEWVCLCDARPARGGDTAECCRVTCPVRAACL